MKEMINRYTVTDKICATTTGNVALCEEAMLELARTEAQNSENCIKWLQSLRNTNMSIWETRSKRARRNKLPYIELIDIIDINAYESGDIVASGTRAQAAGRHLVTLLTQSFLETPLEVLSYLKRSVVVSGK